jgi:hypothetical protein
MSNISDEICEEVNDLIQKQMESKEVKEALKKVTDLEKQAKKLLGQATDILDEYGLGRYFGISPVSQAYCANGDLKKEISKEIAKLHPELSARERDELDDIISDTFSNYDGMSSGYDGWQHSAVC